MADKKPKKRDPKRNPADDFPRTVFVRGNGNHDGTVTWICETKPEHLLDNVGESAIIGVYELQEIRKATATLDEEIVEDFEDERQ